MLESDASVFNVVRERFDANPKREVVSRSVNLSRELFHVVKTILSKSLRLFYGMISVRFLVLTSITSCT